MTVRSLRQLFEPTRILWVGPDQEPAPWARLAEANLWGHGFQGRILSLRSTGHAPVEARIDTLAEVDIEASLGVVCLPQADLPELLAALADRGCRAVNLVGGGTARFSLDAEQARAVRRAAKRLGLRVVGPDRVGVIVPSQHLSLGAATTMPPAGDLAFVTQSDSIANAMLEWNVGARAGFSRVVSLGENAEVELGDVLDYLALDTATRAVLVHLEGIADARRFLSAGRAVARIKPVLVLKAGRQIGPPPAGPGNVGIRLHRDQVYDAAFARAGLVRVGSIEELFAAASSLGAGAVRRGHGLRKGRLDTSVRSAEMMKYCCNNFHALKITFANETARLCEALGVNPFEVMDLVCQDTQLNISRAYLRPGYAFGGSCLPKDLRATTYLAKTHDVDIPMLAGIMASNRSHVELSITKLLETGKRKIGFVGLSFKTGTDDLRESPLVALAEQLVGKGIQLSIYDPEVHLSRLLGANRRFIEQHVPHLGALMKPHLADVVAESEVLVVGLATAEIFKTLAETVKPGQYVLDLVGLPADLKLQGEVEGLCW